MEYFWDNSDTIPDGLGFAHFGTEHLICLGICFGIIAAGCILYRRLQDSQRKKFRYWMVALLLIAELCKQLPLIFTGTWDASYLPLHLCSINIFLVVLHAFRPSKLLDNFLYAICLPGALAALLFPSWNGLPVLNYMYLHSYMLHILLVLYPLALTVGGDIRPRVKDLWGSLLLLIAMAVFLYFFNYWMYDRGIYVNFFFLRTVGKDNPLYAFKALWGNHLYGLPIVVAGVLAVMYGPLELWRKLRKPR